ncbi:exported hypothetical protein [Planktothrix paucivesiculata PCC 9631]|uniref:Uncharacterized protein n=1 Tax=Planktothrix paucivesiculata PCC 9631 TaxID=671071 RepID=A0A7Z9DY44_9CYAN|nr:exported hypothetical protein [Planktothrix paucivesiculata PCC 9631]
MIQKKLGVGCLLWVIGCLFTPPDLNTSTANPGLIWIPEHSFDPLWIGHKTQIAVKIHNMRVSK